MPEQRAPTRYLLDSDVIIGVLRGDSKSIALVESLSRSATILISVVSVAELWAGKSTERPVVRRILQKTLSFFEEIPVSTEIAKQAGLLRRDHGIDLPDALIASTALASKAVLVTANVKHFRTIPKLRIKQLS